MILINPIALFSSSRPAYSDENFRSWYELHWQKVFPKMKESRQKSINCYISEGPGKSTKVNMVVVVAVVVVVGGSGRGSGSGLRGSGGSGGGGCGGGGRSRSSSISRRRRRTVVSGEEVYRHPQCQE